MAQRASGPVLENFHQPVGGNNQLLLALANNPIRWLLFTSFRRRLALMLTLHRSMAVLGFRPPLTPKYQRVLRVSTSRLKKRRSGLLLWRRARPLA